MFTEENYHADKTHLTSTAIRAWLRHPKYYDLWLSGKEKKATPSMVFGNAFHDLMEALSQQEPDRFSEKYEFRTSRRTTRDTNINVLSVSDRDALHSMAISLEASESPLNPFILSSKGKAYPEHIYTWTDPQTERKCKCMVDLIVSQKNGKGENFFLYDWKTCTSAERDKFKWSLKRPMYYAEQAAFYLRGFLKNTPDANKDNTRFVFVAVEKTPPYLLNYFLFSPDDDTITGALKNVDLALEGIEGSLKHQKGWQYRDDFFFTETDLF